MIYQHIRILDIVLEEYLTGAVIIMNLDLWINRTVSINNEIEKRKIFAFKYYCTKNNLAYRRIFVKATTDCKESITNEDPLTFRKKVIDSSENHEIRRRFLNIKQELKPIAPLFANFHSYTFVHSFLNDGFIQSSLDSYFHSFQKIETAEQRLQAIGMIWKHFIRFHLRIS